MASLFECITILILHAVNLKHKHCKSLLPMHLTVIHFSIEMLIATFFCSFAHITLFKILTEHFCYKLCSCEFKRQHSSCGFAKSSGGDATFHSIKSPVRLLGNRFSLDILLKISNLFFIFLLSCHLLKAALPKGI